MSWKDDWRSHKEDTDLSWGDYHDEYFIHRHEREDLAARVESLERQIDDLNDHLEAVTETYNRMHREVFEANIMEEYDE